MDIHQMNKVTDGYYRCPICGREISIDWGPPFKPEKIIAGDETVMHSVNKLSIHGVELKLSKIEIIRDPVQIAMSKIRLERLQPIERPCIYTWAALMRLPEITDKYFAPCLN